MIAYKGTMGLIVVSGATGRLGGRVARRLGGDLRLLVRDPARAPQVPGAEIAVASYDDRTALREVLRGAETVLMVSAAETPGRVAQHRNFVDAAATAGVRHLVYTSFAGASPHATFTLARDHWATEQHIRASGLEWTFLRDNLYADFLPDMAGPEGVLRGPPGQGRLAAVARADVIDVAVTVLAAAAAASAEPTIHDGVGYSLTGPQSLTLDEIAAIISGVTGRKVSYQDETLDEAYASRAGYGAPAWQVDAWVSTYTAIAAGELAEVTDDVEGVTGHPPISLRALLGG